MVLMRLLVTDTFEQSVMPEHSSYKLLGLLEACFIYPVSILTFAFASGSPFAEHAARALIYILPKHHDSFLSLFTPTLFCSSPELRCSACLVRWQGYALTMRGICKGF